MATDVEIIPSTARFNVGLRSKIATRLGFRELGRSSVEYRKMFGESPSTTLRLAVRKHQRRAAGARALEARQRARAARLQGRKGFVTLI